MEGMQVSLHARWAVEAGVLKRLGCLRRLLEAPRAPPPRVYYPISYCRGSTQYGLN